MHTIKEAQIDIVITIIIINTIRIRIISARDAACVAAMTTCAAVVAIYIGDRGRAGH